MIDNFFEYKIEANNISDLYIEGIKLLKNAKEFESRAGKTKELIGVISVLTNPRTRYILEENRKHSIDYIKKEFIWYISKTNSVKEIAKASKFWLTVSDDGETVNSAYGKSIFTIVPGTNKTQYDLVKEELEKNPNSRRAFWFYNLFNEHYHKMSTTKDFPCTLISQFLIRNNKLHQIIYIRSCDFIFGWCNDIPFYSLMQEMLSVDLEIELGNLIHIAGSLHIYERHFKLLEITDINKKYDSEEMIKKQIIFPKMTKEDVETIKRYPCTIPNTEFMKFLFDFNR